MLEDVEKVSTVSECPAQASRQTARLIRMGLRRHDMVNEFRCTVCRGGEPCDSAAFARAMCWVFGIVVIKVGTALENIHIAFASLSELAFDAPKPLNGHRPRTDQG